MKALNATYYYFSAIFKSSRNKKGYEKNQKKCDHHKYGKQIIC